MRIAVCTPQVPFIHGGAEIMSEDLVEELRKRGHEAEPHPPRVVAGEEQHHREQPDGGV